MLDYVSAFSLDVLAYREHSFMFVLFASEDGFKIDDWRKRRLEFRVLFFQFLYPRLHLGVARLLHLPRPQSDLSLISQRRLQFGDLSHRARL